MLGGMHLPRPPRIGTTALEPFSFLNLHQIPPAKIRLIKMSKFNALVLEKISEYAFDMKHFQRAHVI